LLKFLTMQACQEALLYDPTDAQTFYMVGILLNSYEERDAAEGFLLQSLELQQSGATYRWLGIIQIGMKRPKDAEIIWNEGLTRSPVLGGQMWEDMAIYHRSQKQWYECAQCGARALYMGYLKRPDFDKSIIRFARGNLAPADNEKFDKYMKIVPQEIKEMEAAAIAGRKQKTLTTTQEFNDWLEARNRTLGRNQKLESRQLNLTNAMLPPKVDGTVAAVTTPTSPTPPSGGNLLTGIDTNRHAVRGAWQKKTDSLVSPTSKEARIELPAQPPQEYNLEFSVLRLSGTGELVVGLVREGVQSAAFVDRAGQSGIPGGPALFRQPLLKRGRPAKLRFEVRRSGVSMFVNGRKAFARNVSGDLPETPRNWQVRNQFGLFLGSNSTGFAIRDLKLTPAKNVG